MSKQSEKNGKLVSEYANPKLSVKSFNVSEDSYRDVVESQIELVFRFLSDGQLTFVNDAFCRYFEKKSEELIGQNFMQFILPEDRPKVEKHLASLSRKNPIAMIDRRVKRPSGIICWQQCIDRAIFNSRGPIIE